MGIFRKENGEFVPKAGFTGIIDNILNKFSNNAVSNKTVTKEFDRINTDLSANSNHFYFDYQNGKYGYNIDPNRGAGTFSPFNTGTPEYIDDIVATGNASAGTKTLNIGSKDYRYLCIKSNDSYAMVELVNGSTIPFGFGDMNYNFRCGEVNSINDHSCTIRYSNGYTVRSSSSGTWTGSTSVFVPRAVYGLK